MPEYKDYCRLLRFVTTRRKLSAAVICSAFVAEDREILGDNKIIGISCHTLEQALEAQEAGADYIGVGAIFPTFTGDDFVRVTIDTLKEIAEKIHIPITAIGGINKNNIRMIFDCNVDSVSLTSAVFSTGDVAASTQELKQKFDMILSR